MLNEGVIGDGEERVMSVEDWCWLGECMVEFVEWFWIGMGWEGLIGWVIVGKFLLGIEVVLKVENIGEMLVGLFWKVMFFVKGEEMNVLFIVGDWDYWLDVVVGVILYEYVLLFCWYRDIEKELVEFVEVGKGEGLMILCELLGRYDE